MGWNALHLGYQVSLRACCPPNQYLIICLKKQVQSNHRFRLDSEVELGVNHLPWRCRGRFDAGTAGNVITWALQYHCLLLRSQRVLTLDKVSRSKTLGVLPILEAASGWDLQATRTRALRRQDPTFQP